MSTTADQTIAAIEEAERIAPRENDVLYEDHWISEMIRAVATSRDIEGHDGARLVRINHEPYKLPSTKAVLSNEPANEGPVYLPGDKLPVNTGIPCAPCLNDITWSFIASKPDAPLPEAPTKAKYKVLIAAGSLVVEFQFCKGCMDSYRDRFPGIVTEWIL